MSVAWVAAHLRMVVCIRGSGSSSKSGGCGDDVWGVVVVMVVGVVLVRAVVTVGVVA